MQKAVKKRTKRVSDINTSTLELLEKGNRESSNLMEMFAIDFFQLLSNVFPYLPETSIKMMEDAKNDGFVSRIRLGAKIIAEYWKGNLEKGITECILHNSDIIRGFGCYIIGSYSDYELEKAFTLLSPLADDHHFGVREWAWLGIRERIVADPDRAITLLSPWVYHTSPNIRRFASEATRPRGVWCPHINVFKINPEKALEIIEPLKSDSSKYVRDSVANWLNDASKTCPDWVERICDSWEKQSPTKETVYICKKALRSIRKKRNLL